MKKESQAIALSPGQLHKEIIRLRKGTGIHGNDVRKRLGDNLLQMAGIEDHDPAGVVTDKLNQLFAPVISRLPEEERAIAEVELNTRAEDGRVVRRRRAHRGRGGPSLRSSADKMSEIALEMARQLMSSSRATPNES